MSDSLPAASGVLIGLYLLTAGLVIYPGIQALWLASTGQRVRLNLALAAMSLSACAFQFGYVGYYSAGDVTAAAGPLRWQVHAVGVFLIAFFVFVAVQTGQRAISAWLAALTSAMVVLLALNQLQPFGLRFVDLQPLDPLRLPWGEWVARYGGEPGIGGQVMRLLIVVEFGWALWRTLAHWRRTRQPIALSLIVGVVLLLLSSGWGALVDFGYVDGVYVAGFAYCLLAMLLSQSLALDLRDRTVALAARTAQLQATEQRRQKGERTIRHIAAGVANETGEAFFSGLASELCAMFDAQAALVLVDDAKDTRAAAAGSLRLLTLRISAGEAPPESFDCASHDWCAAPDGGVLVVAEGARQRWPQDRLLAHWQVESLISMPLAIEGRRLGQIAVLHRGPMDDPTRVVDILQICCARAAAEIERMQAVDALRRLAFRDRLTGLGNRLQFQSWLEAQRARAGTTGGCTVLLVDLDHFNAINEALSHGIGDRVLGDVAERLRAAVDDAELARVGGDEFAIGLRSAGMDVEQAIRDASTLAERLMTTLSAPLLIDQHVLNVRASIGIAFDDGSIGGADALGHAGLAVTRAKSLGRNRINVYEAPMLAAAERRLQLLEGLRSALDGDQLQLHYQPKFDADRRLLGAEALLRWQHPQLGNIPPAEFIGLAEASGLIHAVGDWVLDRACRDLARWHASEVDFSGRLAVNVSPWQLTRGDFVERIEAALRSHAIGAERLVFEITETALIFDLADAVEKLQRLRALGCQISLDDFGTGAASLAHVKALPLDELKIDRSFIADLEREANAALVQSIIAVGRHMRLAVLAEGVETAEQQRMLVAMGCTAFQGHLFSAALPEPTWRALLDSRAASAAPLPC